MEYNQQTVVQGRLITLTPEEKLYVEAFHQSRVAFAFLKDGTCALNVKDKREHKVYLKEDFGVSEEEFETLTRGYIKSGRIVFYKTLNFLPVENLSTEVLKTVSEKAFTFFGSGKYEIWNGIQVGQLGQEWPPVQKCGVLFLKGVKEALFVPTNAGNK